MKRRISPVVGILDQGLSALSNVLVVVAVARDVTPDRMGAFVLVLMVLNASIGVTRALLGEPSVVIAHGLNGLLTIRSWLPLTGVAMLIGVGVSVVTWGVVAGILDLRIDENSTAILLAIPALMGLDYLRWVGIAQLRQHWTLLADMVWTLGIGGWLAIDLLSAGHLGSPGQAWVISGVIGGLLLASALMLSRAQQIVAATSPREIARLGRPGAKEVFLGAIGLQVGFYFATAALGAAVVAEVRGAMILLGPLGILASGLTQWLIPHLSLHQEHAWRAVVRGQLALVALTAAVSLALVLLPDAVGQELLGGTWAGARRAFPLIAAYTACSAAFVLARGAVLAHRVGDRLYRLRRVDVLLIPLLFAVGASVGSVGFMLGIAISGAVDLAMVMVVLSKAARVRAVAS